MEKTTKVEPKAVRFLTDIDSTVLEHGLELGLTGEEFDRLRRLLGRMPNKVELGIVSAMWSEHCSYKSTKAHLSKLPTTGAKVLVGPGENAGAIDVGDGLAIVFKIESHNHPSMIEPFQGAATGVGGILRDVFTMGARPFACANLLRFGDTDLDKTPHLVDGVVRGIAHYGNCFGVPTVLSNVDFHSSYNGNILVNALAVGVAKKDDIFLGTAQGVGNCLLYVGAKTGKDGIQGAVMASENFGEELAQKRPTVQVGNPFMEKLLLEACLKCFSEELVVGIQDMGAAGLTSSSFEMAGRSSTGLTINLDRVPLRDLSMSAYEIMLSESQERMLMVVKPEHVEQVRAIFSHYNLDCSNIGVVTGDGLIRIQYRDRTVAQIGVKLVIENAPRLRRPHVDIAKEKERDRAEVVPLDTGPLISAVLNHVSLADTTFITDQFDHHIGLNTLVGPNEADAVLIQIPHSEKAIAIALNSLNRVASLDPFEGAKRSVCLSALQCSAVGAKPAALSDCLNYGSPENPQIMGQIIAGLEGIAQVCTRLGIPVVSGNVSLYNESSQTAIAPTPAIALIGLNERPKFRAVHGLSKPGHILSIMGHLPTKICGSEVFCDQLGLKSRPSSWNLDGVAVLQERLHQAVIQGVVTHASVIERGGLIMALARMMKTSPYGCQIDLNSEWLLTDVPLLLFSEDFLGVLLCLSPEEHHDLSQMCAGKVMLHPIGRVVEKDFAISLENQVLWQISKADLLHAHLSFIKEFIDGP